ncbi:WGR domain-containing protein [Microbacterium sp. 77mftsu3.1]|uniref:WGR domain-containing protein n=1 Tax=Microbacterium sp. 77mftsu3.1 TaxID=1761802 RepID=UPI00035CC954|nr:WGR domain-containing protein [Microbacterium sp. 77mftsu3.1]SDH41641.1 poly [ADP-ribose] polymerase [Microbacterium sp. 77mftsu3.1]
MSTIIEQKLLVYVDSTANSNKFYRLQLHDTGTVEKLWGRVKRGGESGELSGQTHREGGGKTRFDRILHEKTRKGYVEVKVADTTSAPAAATVALRDTAAASLGGGSTDKIVLGLIDRLVAANKHALMQTTGGMISVDTSGQARTALGIITADAVADARQILNDMATLPAGPRRASLTEAYLRIVPHDVPVRLGGGWAAGWLDTLTSVAAQRDLLDALAASASYADAARRQATTGGTSAVDEDFFRYRVTRLEPGHDEYDMVVARFHETKQAGHAKAYAMTPKYVYRLEDRRHADDVAATAKRVRNVQRLWHGTGAANVLSILQKGLFVPPRTGSGIHIAGRMFGDGLYLSRSATKSLNYSTGHWGGGTSPSTFMFLTRTAMGYEYRPTTAPGWNSFVAPVADGNGKKYDSVNALPGVSGVVNHEAIVKDPMQVELSWLVEF